MIGPILSPILVDLENSMWEFQAENPNIPADFTENALMASTKIFADCVMDFMWKKMKSDSMPMSWREQMATKLGQQIRQMLIDNTGIDPHVFYAKYKTTEATQSNEN